MKSFHCGGAEVQTAGAYDFFGTQSILVPGGILNDGFAIEWADRVLSRASRRSRPVYRDADRNCTKECCP